jgi:hypothetical protein
VPNSGSICKGLYDLRIAQQEAGKTIKALPTLKRMTRRPRIDQLPTCRMMLELARSRVAHHQEVLILGVARDAQRTLVIVCRDTDVVPGNGLRELTRIGPFRRLP